MDVTLWPNDYKVQHVELVEGTHVRFQQDGVMWLIWRLLINAAALWVATEIVPGITFDGDWRLLFAVALVFGVLNVSIRPLLKLLTFPILILSLGLFIFVVNAIMLWLTGYISEAFDLGFHVDGFGAAFIGALVVTFVSFMLSLFVPKDRKDRKDWER